MLQKKRCKVGLTGGIGSGKSYVAKVFIAMGTPVYFADDRAKHLMVADRELRSKLTALLGKEAYLDKHRLNKTHIAQQIFYDTFLLDKINALVHPVVMKDFEKWTVNQQADIVVLEAAIIFESGLDKYLDAVINVSASEDIRIQRVCERDRLDVHQVKARMNSQWSDEQKRIWADYIIHNDGEDLLLPQITGILNQLI